MEPQVNKRGALLGTFSKNNEAESQGEIALARSPGDTAARFTRATGGKATAQSAGCARASLFSAESGSTSLAAVPEETLKEAIEHCEGVVLQAVRRRTALADPYKELGALNEAIVRGENVSGSDDPAVQHSLRSFLDHCAMLRGCAQRDPRSRPYSARYFDGAPARATCCALDLANVLPREGHFAQAVGLLDKGRIEKSLDGLPVDSATREKLANEYLRGVDAFEQTARRIFSQTGPASVAFVLDLGKRVWQRLSDYMSRAVSFLRNAVELILGGAGSASASQPETPVLDTAGGSGLPGAEGASEPESGNAEPSSAAKRGEEPEPAQKEGRDRGGESAGLRKVASDFGRLLARVFESIARGRVGQVGSWVSRKFVALGEAALRYGKQVLRGFADTIFRLAVWFVSNPQALELILTVLNEWRKKVCWYVSSAVALRVLPDMLAGDGETIELKRFSRNWVEYTSLLAQRFGTSFLAQITFSDSLDQAVRRAVSSIAGYLASAVSSVLSAATLGQLSVPTEGLRTVLSAVGYALSVAFTNALRVSVLPDLMRAQLVGSASMVYGLLFDECLTLDRTVLSGERDLDSVLDRLEADGAASAPVFGFMDQHFADILSKAPFFANSPSAEDSSPAERTAS